MVERKSCHIDKMKLYREVTDNIHINQEGDDIGHRNGCSPDVEANSNQYENGFNVEVNTRPSRVIRKPTRFNECVCSLFVVSYSRSRKPRCVPAPTPATPRPCVHCERTIECRSLLHRHMQYEHRDVLASKRNTHHTQLLLSEIRARTTPEVLRAVDQTVMSGPITNTIEGVRESERADKVITPEMSVQLEEDVRVDDANGLETRLAAIRHDAEGETLQAIMAIIFDD